MFSKSIKVNTSIDEKTIQLIIKGNVIPTPGKLRQKIGLLRSSTNRIDFGNVFFQEINKQNIELENDRNSNITLTLENCPDYIKIEIQPKTIKPGEKGEIAITINSKNKNTYGILRDIISISMNFENQKYMGTINITARVIEDFTQLSAKEKTNAPVIRFPKKSIIIGEIDIDQSNIIEVEYENIGKRELFIRNITSNSNLCSISEYDEVVKPGKKGKLKIHLKSKDVNSNFNTNINVISNDPNNSETTLKIINSKIREKPVSKENQNMAKYLKVLQAHEVIKKYADLDKLVIMDVRTTEEYKDGCITGALNFDLKDGGFYSSVKQLDKSKLYLVYSESGKRSEAAIEIMHKLGFNNILHMFEGIEGWEKNKLEIFNPNK